MTNTTAAMTLENLNAMTLINLKKLAKDMNVSFASKIRKAELIDLILTAQVLDEDPIKEEGSEVSKDDPTNEDYERYVWEYENRRPEKVQEQTPVVKTQEYVQAHTFKIASVKYVVLNDATKAEALRRCQSKNKDIISVFKMIDNVWGVVLANGAIYKIVSEANKFQLLGYLKDSQAHKAAYVAMKAAQQKAQQQAAEKTAEKAAEEIIGNITNDKPKYSHKDVDMITGHNIRKAVEWQRQQHSAISEWEKSHKEKIKDSFNVKPDRKAEATADAVIAKQANVCLAADDAALKAVGKAGDAIGKFLAKFFDKK